MAELDPIRTPAEEQLAATLEVLRVSEERYRVAFQTSLDAIAIFRIDDGMFVDVNPAFHEIVGYDREELVGQTSAEISVWVDNEGQTHNEQFLDVSGASTNDLQIWADPADWTRLVDQLNTEGVCRNYEGRFRKKSGEIAWGKVSASVIELDGVRCALCIIRDVTTAKFAEEEIRTLSYYDPLTCLPNRRYLFEQVDRALDEPGSHLRAVLVIDLDNFAQFNDVYGHPIGDLILQEAARRLSYCAEKPDLVARLGSDEFVAVLMRLSADAERAAAQAQNMAMKMLDALALPWPIGGRNCACTASIGITVFRHDEANSDDILQQAGLAITYAKAEGRNRMRHFSPELQASVNTRARIIDDLRLSIGSDQFKLLFQPQMHGDSLIGAEALLRWHHPERGLISPLDFIPLAEETRMILPLGDWVLDAACRQLKSWSERYTLGAFTLAVNISASQFRDAAFPQRVLSILERTGADPHHLEIELTESMLMENTDDVIARMRQLKEHGVHFALDDFGTGYSSLSYLKHLPLNRLKIDIAFVRDILTETSSSAIAQAIISLCRAMNITVLAEGVETEEQRNYLDSLGCHNFQGYLFSRPLPAAGFEPFLARIARERH